MANFSLPNVEDSVIHIKNEQGEVLGSVDSVDVINLVAEAQLSSEKLAKDQWVIFQDLIYENHKIELGSKGAAVALYQLAFDMLVELKKKSSPSLKQSDSTELPQAT